MTKEALYFEAAENGIKCRLCPHSCLIHDGKTGICKVRRNAGGKLIAESWGKISSMHRDPLEKKPLYHFFPGKSILSVGSVGCNMHCMCCQNWQISQVSTHEFNFDRETRPEEILSLALSDNENVGVAYTYNEPSVWYEYMMDIARLVNSRGLKNVMVSNGFISEEPLTELLQYMDAFNIDLKGFNEAFYRSFTGASLAPVLRTLKKIREAQKHLEITCLIIPAQNDDLSEFKKMIGWIADNLGNRTVLHLSKYHPEYKMTVPATSANTLEKLLNIAQERLFHVYVGNIILKSGRDTKCSSCGNIVITRTGYITGKIGLSDDGTCKYCGNKEFIC